MVKTTDKLKPDPTIALTLLATLTHADLFQIMQTHLITPDNNLYDQLQQLHDTDEGNEVSVILNMMEKFQDHYSDKIQQLSTQDQERVTAFFEDCCRELSELLSNIHSHQITICCALDGFTLNKTTYLIGILEDFIAAQTPAHYTGNISYYSPRKHYLDFEMELALANDLKFFSETLRAQIGSPETMPKALVISLMVKLCDILHICQENETLISDTRGTLKGILLNEIEQLRIAYPELADAGEELQKAIAIYRHPKP